AWIAGLEAGSPVRSTFLPMARRINRAAGGSYSFTLVRHESSPAPEGNRQGQFPQISALTCHQWTKPHTTVVSARHKRTSPKMPVACFSGPAVFGGAGSQISCGMNFVLKSCILPTLRGKQIGL